MNPLGTGDPLRLGPYRLIGVLGAGGMGKVYLGRDSNGRPTAIKVLRPELAYDATMSQRFVREAHAAEAVRSKGVARVLGAQTEGGRPWIATEFLAGPTLDQAIDRHGPFSPDAVRAIGSALARTLDDIHTAGLVHRDLKPANIVLTSAGPRVIDFGIARPEHGLTLTTTGQAPVTPGYGPPEQVLGKRVGPPADVFALGSVLAYVATGERAFAGDHVAAVQYEVVHGEPRLGGLPPDLYPLVAPCLAKEAEGRPAPAQIAKAMAPPRGAQRAWTTGDLAADIAEREQQATRLAALPAAGDAADGSVAAPSRRRLLAGLAAGGVVVAAGGGAAAWWWLGREGADGNEPWAAQPLGQYDEGKAPDPLWGPVRATAQDASLLVPARDVLVVPGKDSGMTARDVRTGERRWTSKEITPAAGALPTADGSVLIGANSSGDLIGLGTKDGERAWAVRGSAVGRLLAVDDTAAYVVTRDQKLRAVSLSAHEPLWTVRLPVDSSADEPPWAAAAEGFVVLVDGKGKVAAVDAGTGKTAWGPATPGEDAPPKRPAVAGGVVYFGGRQLTAVGLRDGNEKWSHKAASDDGFGAPVVDGERLYVMDGADFGARKTADGSGTWTVGLEAWDRPADPPVVEGNTAWVMLDKAGEEGVVAVDLRSGQTAWTYVQGSTIGPWHAAAAGNRVFLLQQGTVTAMPVV